MPASPPDPVVRTALAVLVVGSLVSGATATTAATAAESVAVGTSDPVGPDPTSGPVRESVGDHTDDPHSAPTTREPPPRLVSLLPNPVAPDDRGERVVVRLAALAPGASVTLTDGEDVHHLPTPTGGGRVVVTDGEGNDTARASADAVRVVRPLALSNAGETLALRVNGTVVDDVAYTDAPEGERLERTGQRLQQVEQRLGRVGRGLERVERGVERTPASPQVGRDAPRGWRWSARGLTERPVVRTGASSATAFTLPDAPGVVTDVLRSADRRIYLAGYTFTSRRVTEALVAAAARGVAVHVLVEGSPVGGMSRRAAARLDTLAANGVRVSVVDGPRDRYAYHHPKYAVVDSRALVLTENWKPSGVGGRDNRGWGVVVDSRRTAGELAAVFAHDAGWRDTVAWEAYRAGRSFRDVGVANGTYPRARDPRRVDAHAVDVWTAPGNAERALVAELDGAERRIDVLQPTVGGRSQPFVRALVRAARRGVEVRLLLGSAWYVREENERLAGDLNGLAERESLPLTVRLARGRGRFGDVHAKGVVVDDTAVVGSLNWNNASARRNREVVVALRGAEPAAYYRGSFDGDWRRAGEWHVPRLLLLVAVGAVAAALVLGRRYLDVRRERNSSR